MSRLFQLQKLLSKTNKAQAQVGKYIKTISNFWILHIITAPLSASDTSTSLSKWKNPWSEKNVSISFTNTSTSTKPTTTKNRKKSSTYHLLQTLEDENLKEKKDFIYSYLFTYSLLQTLKKYILPEGVSESWRSSNLQSTQRT